MAKQKLKKKVQSRPSVGKITDPVFESARDIWLAGLGAFSVAQKEGGKIVDQGSKMFDKLVAEGNKLENTTRRKAESTVSGVRGDVEERARSTRRQVKDNWDKLETVFEERVARVLARLGVPTADDIRQLTERVSQLSAKVADANRKTASETARSANVYHLLPKADDWAVRHEGSEEELSVHSTKNEALEAARGIAHAHQPSRLVVHKTDGTIQTSYNYGE